MGFLSFVQGVAVAFSCMVPIALVLAKLFGTLVVKIRLSDAQTFGTCNVKRKLIC